MRQIEVTLEPQMRPEETKFITSLLTSGNLTGKHLEIGTAAGGSLRCMMLCYPDASRPPFVVVDPFKYFPNQLATVQRNLREHALDPAKVDFRATTSAEALAKSQQQNERFDFIVIDGSHKIMAVTADLNWTSLLNVGGIVCFHDFTTKNMGVYRPIKRFVDSHKNFENLGTAGNVLALRKKAESTRPAVSILDWLVSSFWYLPLQIKKSMARRNKSAS